MDRKRYYRQDGYHKGFEEAKRTGGEFRHEYVDNYLDTETKYLSASLSKEFVDGWYEGFRDGVGEGMLNLARKADFWEYFVLG